MIHMDTTHPIKYRSSIKAAKSKSQPIKSWRDEYSAILRAVHILDYVRIDQLIRLLATSKENESSFRYTVRDLVFSGHLRCTQQPDPTGNRRKMPYVYSDTTKGRREIEQRLKIPFHPLSHKPATSVHFFPHNLGMSDVMISFMKTARKYDIPVKHTHDITAQGIRFKYPVTIAHQNQSLSFALNPDQSFALGRIYVFPEYCRGRMDVRNDDLRIPSLFKKILGYHQLKRNANFKNAFGVREFIVPFIINSRADNKEGAQERIANTIRKMPRRADRKLFYFIDPFTLAEAGDDISKLEWLRGDGKCCSLPTF